MNPSDGPWAAPASSGQMNPPVAALTPPAARHVKAEPGPATSTSPSRDLQPGGHESNADPNSPPGRGIQAWACLRLADGTRRLAAIPASPRQASTEAAGRAREPELEAEP
jgi:hypothetical protein